MKELEKYKGYFIDENGNLFSTKSNKYIKHRLSKFGYIRVGIYHNGKSKQLFIHRLLAETFIPNPENKKDVNHINGIKSDFSLENLEWNTRSENMKHSYKELWNKWIWLWIFWKEHNCSKKVNQYTLHWGFIKTWDCMKDIQRELNIVSQNISKVCRWKQKTAWWYIWKYLK